MTHYEHGQSMAFEGIPFVIDDIDGAPSLPATTYKPPPSPRRPPQQQQAPQPVHDTQDDDDAPPSAPSHPIPVMQAAFQESLTEATQTPSTDQVKPSLRALNASSRRLQLIEQAQDAPLAYRNWRYRPGQTQHELWKLMAQISFGVYLMLTGRSNSTDQVILILQGHIDDIDEFLEVALEDINEAIRDLQVRIGHLRLPMENRHVFEELLRDRGFRAELMSGSETIEHVLSRTTLFAAQCTDDITNGLASTLAFSAYLRASETLNLAADNPEVSDIYDAMVNNTDGWHNTFTTLRERNEEISQLILSLTRMLADMQRIAGDVSRRTLITMEATSVPAAASIAAIQAAHLEHIEQATLKSAPPSVYGDIVPDRPFSMARKSIRLPMPGSSGASIRARSIMSIPVPRSPHPGDGALTPPPDGRTMTLGVDDVMMSRRTSRGRDDDRRSQVSSDIKRTTLVTKEDDAVYLLQPKVYTPVPSTSPTGSAPPPISPPHSQSSPPRRPSATSQETTEEEPMEEPLLLLSGKRYSKNHTSEAPPEIPDVESEQSLSPRHSRRRTFQQQFDEIVEVDLESDSDSEGAHSPLSPTTPYINLPRQRTSLRQRVSHTPQHITIPPPQQQRQVSAPMPRYYSVAPPAGSTGQLSPHPPTHQRNRSNSSGARLSPELARWGGSHPNSANNTPTANRPPTLTLAPPNSVPATMQFYHPVLASPHSPLQQRPHTSHNSPRPTLSPPLGMHHASYHGSMPSPSGGQSHASMQGVNRGQQAQSMALPYRASRAASQSAASTKSGGTDMTIETQPDGERKVVKKKKSKFGWLKKAFQLDEEERAAFEARRAMATRNLYYDERSREFLDGRRRN